ncbi:phosphate transporter PHO1 homolog 10-like [Vicia villosa]|uniref:phosphate transporter PHO1 homolog 10-like n=1 Tax=Vicia villosa TaxID=3911 RepID=UPI00273C12DB|nr:phosphate transporter PHO1 homolog 10-like [Vicia villosa]
MKLKIFTILKRAMLTPVVNVLRLSLMLVLELDWCLIHKVAIITFISCLEIDRHGIWNFFRIDASCTTGYVLIWTNGCPRTYDVFFSCKCS